MWDTSGSLHPCLYRILLFAWYPSIYHITTRNKVILCPNALSPKLFGKEKKMRGHLALRQGLPLHPFPKQVA